MNWQANRAACRARFVAKYNSEEALAYDGYVGTLAEADELAYLADITNVFRFSEGMSVLDVGAGTGALSKVLTRVPGLSQTAMEPSPAMLNILKSKPELSQLAFLEGSCDRKEDRSLVGEGQFDVIVSRQVANGLFDPLVAFQNWHHWLVPGGAVIVIDGFYGRDGWRGIWEEELDVLPLSACQTMATIPYLLEASGFSIDAVEMMKKTNEMPATRTKRYIVVAKSI